jgi:hypothetical protein
MVRVRVRFDKIIMMVIAIITAGNHFCNRLALTLMLTLILILIIILILTLTLTLTQTLTLGWNYLC